MTDMGEADGLHQGADGQQRRRMTAGQAWLAAGVLLVGLTLTPLAFTVLFATVNQLLMPYFHWLAWTVPLITEVGFAGLYLARLLLALIGRDLAWLRIAPWALAAISALLNVWAGHGVIPAIAGHLAVVLVFFGYLLAAEQVVLRLAEDPAAIRLAIETRLACRYARDLLRDREGFWWRFKVPTLLRSQVLKARLPADVTRALAAGAESWEPAVRRFVVGGLTAGAWMRAEESATRRRIEATAKPSPPAADGPSPAPVTRPSPRPSAAPAAVTTPEQQRLNRDRVTDLLKANEDLADPLTLKEIADEVGVSVSTVERAKRDLQRQPELSSPAVLRAVNGKNERTEAS